MTTDCMTSGETASDCAMLGSAVFTIVESSVSMKNPIATSQRRMRGESVEDCVLTLEFGEVASMTCV